MYKRQGGGWLWPVVLVLLGWKVEVPPTPRALLAKPRPREESAGLLRHLANWPLGALIGLRRWMDGWMDRWKNCVFFVGLERDLLTHLVLFLGDIDRRGQSVVMARPAWVFVWRGNLVIKGGRQRSSTSRWG